MTDSEEELQAKYAAFMEKYPNAELFKTSIRIQLPILDAEQRERIQAAERAFNLAIEAEQLIVSLALEEAGMNHEIQSTTTINGVRQE